jgi:hypothetical protein
MRFAEGDLDHVPQLARQLCAIKSRVIDEQARA